MSRRWRGKITVAPGGVGGEVEPITRSQQERLSELLDLPRQVYKRTGARTLVVFDDSQDLLRIDSNVDGLLRSKIQFHRDEARAIRALGARSRRSA